MLVIFDRAHFYEVCGLSLYGTVVTRQVIDLFLEHTSSLPADLEQSIAAHDDPAAQRILHQLKNAAAGMGGARLAGLCGALERQENGELAPELLGSQKIRGAYADLVGALREERVQLSADHQ